MSGAAFHQTRACVKAIGHSGITDSATLASILPHPSGGIGEKLHHQGRQWLAREIARAKAKYRPEGAG